MILTAVILLACALQATLIAYLLTVLLPMWTLMLDNYQARRAMRRSLERKRP